MAKRKNGWRGRLNRQRSSAQRSYNNCGYSEISLSMLESKEGQLNAVFACYGSAAQHGQFFEESVARLIVALNKLSGSEGRAEEMEKWTLGRLLNHFQEKFVNEIDEWVPEYLEEGRKLRNFLIHDYFLKRKGKFGTRNGRMAMLKELSDIERHLKCGADLMNGLRVAAGEAVDGRTRKGGEGGEVVFSATLSVGKEKA